MMDNGGMNGGSFRHVVVVVRCVFVGVGGRIHNPNKCASNIRRQVLRIWRFGAIEEIKDAVFPGWSDVPEFDGDARSEEVRWEGAGIP